MASKFTGQTIEIQPKGICHLKFSESGNHYTWHKVKTLVHNLIIGNLWIENNGEMEVMNHKTHDKCHVEFEKYSYFGGGETKKVTGKVTNSTQQVEWKLYGTWDTKIEGSRVSDNDHGTGKVLWKRKSRVPGSEKYYNFSQFACELNEFEEGVAPTDSRCRPDQRLMENGHWDMANREKARLEEKQRAARRKREYEEEEYKPAWFQQEVDDYYDGKLIHVYSGGYWEAKKNQDWHKCPHIF